MIANLPLLFKRPRLTKAILITLACLLFVFSIFITVFLTRQKQEVRKYAQGYTYENEEQFLGETILWPGSPFTKNYNSPRAALGQTRIKQITIVAHDEDGNFEAKVQESSASKFNIISGNPGPDCEGHDYESCYHSHTVPIGCEKNTTAISINFTCESGSNCDSQKLHLKKIIWTYCLPVATPTPTSCPSKCSSQEYRPESIATYCKSQGLSCDPPNSWANPLTCYGAKINNSCHWEPFGSLCQSPYCEGCACLTPTPTPTPTTPTPTSTPVPGGCGAPCRPDGSIPCQEPYTCTYLPSVKNPSAENPRNRIYECRSNYCPEKSNCQCQCNANISHNDFCRGICTSL